MPIPDWNSLDSVRHAHSVLEASALIFFALLVLFDVLAHFSEDKRRERLLEKIGLCCFGVAVFAEIAAYPYGWRNDTLSEKEIAVLGKEAAEAGRKAAEANEKAEREQLARVQLEKSMEWRHLTAAQQHALCSIVSPKGANEMLVRSAPEDPESWSYASEFAQELRNCQISGDFGPNGHLGRMSFGSDVVFGVWVWYSDTPHPEFPIKTRRKKAYWLSRELSSIGVQVAGVSVMRSAGIRFPDLYIGPRIPPRAEQLVTASRTATIH